MRRLGIMSLLVLAACTQPVTIEDETSYPPLPEASYAAAARSGADVYRIRPQESLLLVHVDRSGTMQGLGHDHAVASEDVQGLIEFNDDPSASRAHIVLPIRNLIVDKPEYRERLGLDAGPSEEDVVNTYANMLKVFQPQVYPWIEARALVATEAGRRPTLAVSITLHGSTVEYLWPVDLEIHAERLRVSGEATIKHSDFGISPYSAVGGLLRVADEIDVRFLLVGKALPRH